MSGNKLIAAGNSRLKKAADSSVDPAVPAELQKRAATAAAKQGSVDGQEPSVFARGRVLSADDLTGTPEEQLAYVTERLHEIDLAGKRAEDFTVLNKAVLLEVAQERELHLVAGHTNFSVWAAGTVSSSGLGMPIAAGGAAGCRIALMGMAPGSLDVLAKGRYLILALFVCIRSSRRSADEPGGGIRDVSAVSAADPGEGALGGRL
ncbi:hypothetical protein [Streptomyces mirabilis]|uniref:hypothetical protein n=1 Tax=Streptomyces mirabilis TaxID=68239 RepID=UPI0036E1CFE7